MTTATSQGTRASTSAPPRCTPAPPCARTRSSVRSTFTSNRRPRSRAAADLSELHTPCDPFPLESPPWKRTSGRACMAVPKGAEAGPQVPTIINVPAYVGDSLQNVAVDVRRDSLVDVFNLLKGEAAPLQYWAEIGLAYYHHGMLENYEQVMKEAGENMNFLEATTGHKLAILNSLCAYHTLNIQKLMGKQKEKEATRLLDVVNTYNSQAMHIDGFNATSFAIKAFAYLARGNAKSAGEYFDIALGTLDAKNLPALVGKAIIAYDEKQYSKALDFYSQALKANPRCPGFVRLGMAYCWYRLKNPEKAKLCFQRVVDLEPNNVTALVGLALIDLDIRNKASFERSVKHLKRAFALQADHPMVLNTFADHLFHNQFALNVARKAQGIPPGSYEKAEELASKAANSALNPQVKALAWYQIGRARHAEGDLNEALNYYYQAVSTCKELPLAQYALAQMYVWKGQTEAAIKHFKEVLAIAPEDRDSLLALGQLYIQQENDAEAMKVLRKLTDQHRDIPEAWLLYGYCTRHDTEFALKCYAKAVKLLKDQRQDVNPRAWNDVGMLHHVSGYEEDAERLYWKALREAGGELQQYELEHVPIVLNLARLREDQGRLEESIRMLRGVVERFPSFLEPYLSLARIHLRMKAKSQAVRWLELAMEVDPQRAEPWLMLGDAYSAQKEWIRAQDKYEYVLNHINKSEAHAQLGMGYIYLNALQQASLPAKEEKFSKLAADFYQKALLNDNSNIYAAHGLGCFMAFRGHYDDARKTLARVSQAAFPVKEDTCSDTMLVNYANTHCMVGNFGTAAKMYQNIIKRYPGSVAKHSLYALLGQALFFNGDYEPCLIAMAKAIRTDPNNQRLWFNLALVQMLLAIQQLQELQPGRPELIRVYHYEKARSTLHLFSLSLRAFERIHQYYADFPQHALFKSTALNIAECQRHLTNAQLCLERATEKKQETERKTAQFKVQQQELERKRKQQQEREDQEKRRKEEQLRRIIEQENARLEEMRQRFLQQEQLSLEQQRKKEASKNKRRMEEGDENIPLPPEEEEFEAGLASSSDSSVDYDAEADAERVRKKARKEKPLAEGADGEKHRKHKHRDKHKDKHRDKEKKRKAKEAAAAADSTAVPPGVQPTAEPTTGMAPPAPVDATEERARRKAEKRQRKEEKRRRKEEKRFAKETRKRLREAMGTTVPEEAAEDPDELGDIRGEDDDASSGAEAGADVGAGGSAPRKKQRIAGDDDDEEE
eukprot:GGOE01054550.1.p1 GENE.GGOE01054550.1~~GGOE01054550.1.p1  ORF type:complete len:1236 (+),score=482.77 GGOE01054550.1:811-4518(+)